MDSVTLNDLARRASNLVFDLVMEHCQHVELVVGDSIQLTFKFNLVDSGFEVSRDEC